MNILINRTDAIGDVILTTPIAKAIKKTYPDSKITFLITSRCRDVLIDHKYIDDIWVFDDSLFFFKKIIFLLKKIIQFRPKYYFHIGGSFYPTFVAWFLRVSFRGGLKSRALSYLFLNKGVRQKRSFVSMHEVEYNLSLLNPLKIKYHYTEKENYFPEIFLSSEEVSKNFKNFKDELKAQGMDENKKMVFIHPTMSKSHTLNWPVRNYAQLIKEITQKKLDVNIIVSYTDADKKLLDDFYEVIEEFKSKDKHFPIYFFNGQKKGLRHYLCVLSKASAFIGPSTGNSHMANALKVPQIGLYSPIRVQSSLRWGPFRKDRLDVFVPDVVCGEIIKCAGDSCPYYECMDKIRIQDVFTSLKKMLKE